MNGLTSSVDKACQVIREAIRSGQYPGGSWIREVAVAKRNRRQMAAIEESNNRFHRGILEASKNRHLASLLTAVVQVPMVSQTFARYDQAALERSAAHHQEIVQALRARDPALAQATMRAHILSGKQVIFASQTADAASSH